MGESWPRPGRAPPGRTTRGRGSAGFHPGGAMDVASTRGREKTGGVLVSFPLLRSSAHNDVPGGRLANDESGAAAQTGERSWFCSIHGYATPDR